MIDYELAKELKDAGFPQKGYGVYAPDPATGLNFPNTGFTAYVPTLSELIEACGFRFSLLKRIAPERGSLKDRWKADGYDGTPLEGSMALTSELGSTPEEAVARLWLALNKKQ